TSPHLGKSQRSVWPICGAATHNRSPGCVFPRTDHCERSNAASCSAASYEEAYTQTSTARNALFPLSNGPLKAVWPALLGRLLCEQKRPASGAWGCLY